MSRTTRRKGYCYKGTRNSFAHESEKDAKRNARWADFWEAKGYTLRPDKTDDRRWRRWNDPVIQEIHYHRDNGSGQHCVPGLYCTLKYHRPMRVHVRMDIRKSILMDDWDNAIIGKRMDSNKSLGWMWF